MPTPDIVETAKVLALEQTHLSPAGAPAVLALALAQICGQEEAEAFLQVAFTETRRLALAA